MKRVRRERHGFSTIALAVALAVTASVAVAQGNKPPNPGGGGGGGGGEETSANNLSYPAIEIGGAGSAVSAFFNVSTSADLLGKSFSYGCPDPAYPATAEYPNLSCAEGVSYLTAEACVGVAKPCAGMDPAMLDRIYWQKTTANDWSSDTITSVLGVPVTHVDWGDNLESQTWWSTATIRVETTTFGAVAPSLRGLAMWHVTGKGQTELWGARATQAASLPYVYDAGFAILHTTAARLNIAKISLPEACPTTPGSQPRQAGQWSYTATGGAWSQALLTLYDVPYTAELNIGGKYVHGFNWKLRSDSVSTAIGKAGWWRLTFYSNTASTQPAVVFSGNTLITAPEVAPAMPSLLSLTAEVAAEAETGPLYQPIVVPASNLSYLDICISDAKGGGSKKPR